VEGGLSHRAANSNSISHTYYWFLSVFRFSSGATYGTKEKKTAPYSTIPYDAVVKKGYSDSSGGVVSGVWWGSKFEKSLRGIYLNVPLGSFTYTVSKLIPFKACIALR
jgi:hypothetical protein